ncbi:MAG: hypothetical protein C0483_20825 [Pirellula sp.]|nr:hypothetical protein [Pirellula sp.]
MPQPPRRFSPGRILRGALVGAGLLFATCGALPQARAGGSAESVFLVVNERSWSSLSIANHYIRLRDIPASNVFYLDWQDDNERIDSETCRTKLLKPVFAEIRRRGLHDHIDYVVYSADFPWLIDCTDDATLEIMPPVLAPQASLTGVTFFHEWFVNRQNDYRFFKANGYYRPFADKAAPSSQGFRSWFGWNEEGRLLEAGGMGYTLSAMLGVTSGRGNSTGEVMQALTAAVKADYSKPVGKMYYAKSDDIRSTTRHDLFPLAVEAIKNEGADAEIVEGTLPSNRPDVLGLMTGTAEFSMLDSRCKLRPGAIAENLTSLSGVMYEPFGQTPISEFVRGGAALTAGPIYEPFAVPDKFANPYIQLHYVRGCTAAEAYYQATHGPYQMLVLGDPLCKPWARPAPVALEGIRTGETVAGLIRFVPTGGFEGGAPVSRFELYIDGLLYNKCLPGEGWILDTRALPDGYHELRAMAIGKEPLEWRAGSITSLVVANRQAQLTLSRDGEKDAPLKWGVPAVLKAAASQEGAPPVGIIIMQGTRRIGQIIGASGELRFDPRMLGVGPVRLQAFALGAAGGKSDVVSAPLELYVEPSDPLPTYTIEGGAKFAPGALLTAGKKPARALESQAFTDCLREAQVGAGESFEITGMFNVEEDGVYQFHLRHALQLEVLVDDQLLSDAEHARFTIDYVPVPLATGLHKLTLRGKVLKQPGLDVRFGLRGLRVMSPASMSHVAK